MSLVVIKEGIGQVTDSPTCDGHPLNVERIRGTGDSGIKWVVDIVEKTVSKANIETFIWPDIVDHHTGGAHEGAVVALRYKVYPLGKPDLSRREVTMVDSLLRARRLPVAAD